MIDNHRNTTKHLPKLQKIPMKNETSLNYIFNILKSVSDWPAASPQLSKYKVPCATTGLGAGAAAGFALPDEDAAEARGGALSLVQP